MLEDDDQQGLAHLLEHLAFNGTEAFPEQELVQYLESTGMRFGPDVNAYTSSTETVYMLQVPTDSAAMFTTGLDVLRQWAGSVTITEEEVVKERGVVIEELPARRGASGRVRDVQFPVIYQGSRYAERLPIGTEEVLRDRHGPAHPRFLRRLLPARPHGRRRRGDVDADEVVGMIETGSATSTTRPAPRPRHYDVPGHARRS